jgi:hypothetical protein
MSVLRYLAIALLRIRVWLWARRRLDRRWFVALSVAIGAIELAAVAVAVILIIALAAVGVPVAAGVLVALVAVLLVPHWLAEAVAIPRGWPRLAWWLGAIDPRGDGASWAWLLEARAVARAAAPEAATARLLARLPERLDAVAVVVHGLIAVGQGDRAGGRALLASARELPEATPGAIDLAGEWLAVDAAERGAWTELLDGAAVWPVTPLRYLLEGVAARATGAAAPSDLALALRWLVAPHRWVVRRYLASRPSAPPARPAAPATNAPVDGGAPTEAAAALARAEAAPSPATVDAAIAAWAAAIDDPAWAERQAARAVVLGVAPSQAAAAVSAARDQVVARLVALAVACRAAIAADAPGLRGAVGYRARGRILDGLEVTLDRAERRVEADSRRAPIDEWRDFLAVRAAYEDAVGAPGSDLDRVAFPRANSALGAWAVWLWNQRGQHILSHAITEWLFARARAVGDAAAIEHHGSNRSLAIPS